MSRPERKHSQVLLVEGRDDREVVYQFCNRRGIDNRLHFDVASCDGYERLRARVEAELDTRDTVGIMIDADAMLSQRWQIRARRARASLRGTSRGRRARLRRFHPDQR